MFSFHLWTSFSDLFTEFVIFCSDCESLNFILIRAMAGKVVLCFTISRRYTTLSGDASFVKRAGGLGLIIARTPGYTVSPCKDDFPCVAVDYELGTDILFYIRSTRYETFSFDLHLLKLSCFVRY